MPSLFVFKPDHVIDIITNSSSELFVLKGKTTQHVREMIRSVYPNYLDEYHEVKKSSKLSTEELGTYLEYMSSYGHSPDLRLPKEIYSPYKCGDKTYYHIDNDKIEQYEVQILDIIDPDRSLYFLFSKEDNPNWDYQQKLENLGTRYHLG